MTSDEFWYGDPNLFISYKKAFINKKKREFEEFNYKSWLQGLYIHNSEVIVSDRLSFSINKMMGGKGQPSKETYPSKPYDLHTTKKKEKVDKKEVERKKYFNSFNYFASMKQQFVDKIKKGE